MKKTGILVLMLFCAAMLLCGCAGNADTLASPTPGNGGLMNDLIPGTTDGSGTLLNPQSPGPATTLVPDQGGTTSAAVITSPEDARKVSEEMEDAIGKLSEIDDAYVVAVNGQALVGVRLNEKYQGQVDDRVKKMVLGRVQTVDKNVTGVAVSADDAQVKEIEALAKSLDQASSLSDIDRQAQELMKQITVYQE